MPAALIQQALASYRARLDDELPGRVRRVALFGSHARGEAHEESDVDIFVLLDEVAHGERARALNVGGLLGFELGLAIAPLVLSQAEWDGLIARERLLAAEIARDGIDA